MRCEVTAWDPANQAVRVKTKTGKRLAITPKADEDLGGLVYYPLRSGYASSIIKLKSTELPHITIS